jgi:hypothetical protein
MAIITLVRARDVPDYVSVGRIDVPTGFWQSLQAHKDGALK